MRNNTAYKLENVVAEYDYYTLDQARELIEKENRIRKAKAKRKRRYFLKQKVLGLTLVLIGLVLVFGLDGEAGFPGACAALLGLALFFTRKKVIIID